MLNPTELPKWRTTRISVKWYDTVHSWLSRTLFPKNETLIGHDDPIMVASNLRAPLLRFVYQRLRFMADRLCDSPFERAKFGLEMLQNQVTLRCQQSTVLEGVELNVSKI